MLIAFLKNLDVLHVIMPGRIPLPFQIRLVLEFRLIEWISNSFLTYRYIPSEANACNQRSADIKLPKKTALSAMMHDDHILRAALS